MPRGTGRPWKVVLTCVVVLAVTAGVAWGAGNWRGDTRPSLTAALAAAPADSGTWGYTDWRGVREVVGDRPDPQDLATAADRRDLSTRSVLATSAAAMDELLGWSVADLRWESYASTPAGEIVTVRLDDVSPDAVRRGLRKAGYRQQGEQWVVQRSRLTGVDVSDLMTRVAVLDRQQMVVMASKKALVERGRAVVRGGSDSLAGRRASADTARALAGSQTILLQNAGGACGAADLTDDRSQRQADAAQERTGRLRRYATAARGISDPGGSGFAQTARFAMTFSSPRLARQQRTVRQALSTGPYIGRSGQIADTLRFGSAAVDGSTLTLAFAHDPTTEVFMVGTGPVLFASCG